MRRLLTQREDFKIRQIPEAKILTRPVLSLYGRSILRLYDLIADSFTECIESGHIVLNPDYQREVVWDETRASNLITSILSECWLMYIPKIRLTSHSGLLHTSHYFQRKGKVSKGWRQKRNSAQTHLCRWEAALDLTPEIYERANRVL